MNTVISTNHKNTIVAEHFEVATIAPGKGFNTPFEERFVWVDQSQGLAEHPGKITEIAIFTQLDDNRAFKTVLPIKQINLKSREEEIFEDFDLLSDAIYQLDIIEGYLKKLTNLKL